MDAIADYLKMARSGALGDPFHGLRELGPGAFPAMQSAFHSETDPIIRALIVEAIWQHRQLSTIGFLADALRDPAPDVWKQALDGLVALASRASIQALRSARDRETNAERRAWIEEALDQAAETVATQESISPANGPQGRQFRGSTST